MAQPVTDELRLNAKLGSPFSQLLGSPVPSQHLSWQGGPLDNAFRRSASINSVAESSEVKAQLLGPVLEALSSALVCEEAGAALVAGLLGLGRPAACLGAVEHSIAKHVFVESPAYRTFTHVSQEVDERSAFGGVPPGADFYAPCPIPRITGARGAAAAPDHVVPRPVGAGNLSPRRVTVLNV